ncbi:MAG TPA: thioredoxin domain-containing protein [Pyrinomonadaceae bacterium]|jgi:protein-disulfide isomerase
METKKQKQKGGIPLIVIGAVLVASVMLFAWCSSSNKNAPKNTASQPTVKITPVPQVSEPGSTPPNALGPPNAAVTVEEFADFQCPSCGATYPATHQIETLYGPRIYFIFRNFPLPMHDKAYDAAVASEAAGMQGSDKFWAMHALLYQNQKVWSADPNYKQVFNGYAEKIGLNVDKFETDMAGLATKSRVDADIARGKALNINSTPTLFINGKPVAYPDMNVPTLQRLIDDELKAAQPQASQPAAAGNSAPEGGSGAPSNAPVKK